MTGFFQDAVKVAPDRDRQDRPLLIPENSPAGGLRVAYTRASQLGDYIEDMAHIERWRTRYGVRGLAQRPDLAAMAAAETYSTGFARDLSQIGKAMNSASGRRLDSIWEQAQNHAGVAERANYGTAVHAYTEPDNDQPVPAIHNLPADVAAWRQALVDHGIVLLATEVFTANDRWRAAGTFDHLAYVPGYGVVVVDKKTGDAHDFGVQLVTYALGRAYDLTTGARRPLESLYVNAEYGLVNRDVALVAQIRDGVVEFLEVDLVRAADDADLAAAVRDRQERQIKPRNVTERIRLAHLANKAQSVDEDPLFSLIAVATTHAELAGLWDENRDTWRPAHTAAAVTRKQQLTALA